MASNQRPMQSLNPEPGQENQPDLNRTLLNRDGRPEFLSSTPISVVEVGSRTVSIHTAPNQLEEKIDIDIRKIAQDLDIRKDMAEHLRRLQNFEIVIVCDDSGSMDTPVDGTQRTRWHELCDMVKSIIPIGVVLDSNGIDICFLNRRSYNNVKDPATVDRAFERPPSGYTPLVRALNEIFTSNLAQRGRDKQLLVLVATDGLPTDDNGNEDLDAFRNVMENTRQKDTTYVSFLLCTDEQTCVEYMRQWDKRMTNIDVTDDFNTERARIRKCQKNANYPFLHGDYIVKALVGAIVPAINKLNEL